MNCRRLMPPPDQAKASCGQSVACRFDVDGTGIYARQTKGYQQPPLSLRTLKTKIIHSGGVEQRTCYLALRIARKPDSIAPAVEEVG